jgi:hypothetical protein
MKTRYPELDYEKQGNVWRCLDASTGQAVGPLYKTRAELLADLERYAHAGGWIKPEGGQ